MRSTVRWLRLILATWRLTYLFVQERGPDAVFQRIREHYTGTEVGKALECIYCTSLYAAVAILILDRLCPQLVDVLVVSAGAVLYDKHTSN